MSSHCALNSIRCPIKQHNCFQKSLSQATRIVRSFPTISLKFVICIVRSTLIVNLNGRSLGIRSNRVLLYSFMIILHTQVLALTCLTTVFIVTSSKLALSRIFFTMFFKSSFWNRCTVLLAKVICYFLYIVGNYDFLCLVFETCYFKCSITD